MLSRSRRKLAYWQIIPQPFSAFSHGFPGGNQTFNEWGSPRSKVLATTGSSGGWKSLFLKPKGVSLFIYYFCLHCSVLFKSQTTQFIRLVGMCSHGLVGCCLKPF